MSRSENRRQRSLATTWVTFLVLIGAAPALGLDWTLENVHVSGSHYAFDTSIVVDIAGSPHIAYAFETDNTLRYARRTGDVWDIQEIDQGNVSSSCTSMALGPEDRPQIVYKINGGGLGYASWDGSNWHTETVASAGFGGSIAVGADGAPHVCYIEAGDVKYATRGLSGWVSQVVDISSTPYRPTAIALNGEGYPHMAYWQQAYWSLARYTYWDGSGWHSATIGDAGGTSDADGNVSLTLDSAGVPHITYCSDRQLEYATVEDGSWATRHVPGASGSGIAYHNAVAIGPGGQACIAFNYRLPEEQWFAIWDGSSWDVDVLDTGSDSIGFSSLAVDSEHTVHLSYWRQGTLVYGVGVPEPVSAIILIVGLPWAIRRHVRKCG